MLENIYLILELSTVGIAILFLIYMIFAGVCFKKGYSFGITDCKIRIALTSTLFLLFIAQAVIALLWLEKEILTDIICAIMWLMNVLLYVFSLRKEKKRIKIIESFNKAKENFEILEITEETEE